MIGMLKKILNRKVETRYFDTNEKYFKWFEKNRDKITIVKFKLNDTIMVKYEVLS